jgi:NDP-sugar pyrophosphorylase family protein
MPPLALLAGGRAMRLRPITETVPKAMLPVAGQPFINHQLALLARQRIQRVVLCIGFLGEMIREHVGDGSRFGLEVTYSFDGSLPLGTGGALRKALPLLGDEFMVMVGDSYLPAPFEPALRLFRLKDHLSLMTVYRNDDIGDRSNVVFEDGRILAYDKHRHHPNMVYIDYGLAIFKSQALAGWPVGVPFELADVFQLMLQRDQLIGHEVFERFHEIGSTKGLAEARRFLPRLDGQSSV